VLVHCCAFCGEIRPVAVRRHAPTLPTDPRRRMHKDEPLTGMWRELR